MNIKRMIARFRFMDENVEASGAGSSGGTEVSGGVGNGQATGTGQVSDSFDTAKAMESISSSLFGAADEGKGNVQEKQTTTPPTDASTKTEVTTAVTPPTPPTPAPKTWKPEEQAAWEGVPEAAKAAILRREEDIFRGIEQYKAPAEFGTKITEILKPYEQIMRANSMDPAQTIGNLLQAHHTLATSSPQNKAAFLSNLAKQYGVDMSLVEGGQTDAYTPVSDPEVLRLREELHAVQLAQQTSQQQRYEEVRAQKANEVNAFAADPKNVHFEKLADLMVPMLKDPSVSLAQAYEKAMWLHPEVRELVIAQMQSEKQAKAIADGKAAAEAARKAQAANVKVGPKAGAATTPLGTMDDTMQSVLAAIRGR